MNALNVHPYAPRPCRSRTAIGITVVTARPSKAMQTTASCSPTVRGPSACRVGFTGSPPSPLDSGRRAEKPP